MSGIIGHMMYAVLAEKAAAKRRLPIVPVLRRHYASYLAGAYLGCDIQTLPEAICLDTGEEVGYGTVPLQKSPLTGGKVKPWKLTVGTKSYTPREIHTLFYGRSHLVFGWSIAERRHTLPWDHLPDFIARVIGDAVEFFGPGERQLAYLFGWANHIVGDSLIKSVRPTLSLKLLDGQYTPKNRPIQDLVTYHEIGRKELHLNWQALMTDLAETPVEKVQLHYMRSGKPRGRLAADFPNAWMPGAEPLLRKVLAENRRYQRIRNPRLWKQLKLRKTQSGWNCSEELSEKTGGLSYSEMVEAAEKADFRHALWQIAEAAADLYEQIIARQPLLQELPKTDGPTWDELTRRWKRLSPP